MTYAMELGSNTEIKLAQALESKCGWCSIGPSHMWNLKTKKRLLLNQKRKARTAQTDTVKPGLSFSDGNGSAGQ